MGVVAALALSIIAAPAYAQIDPQAQALLDRFAAAAASAPKPVQPQSTAEWIAAARAGYHMIDGLGGAPEPVGRIENGALQRAGGVIPYRLYNPRGGGAPRPLVVYFHGGGFTAGDLDTHDRLMRQLANRSRAVIVSVAYRLAPENPYPAGLDDAVAALRWAAGEARVLGADPKRLIVAGDSAGGLIAAASALRLRDEGGPRLARQILLYPNTDLRAGVHHASWRSYDGLILKRADMDRGLNLLLPAGIDRTGPYVSPLLARNLKGLPPAVVITGEYDPQRDEGEAYAERLGEAGVPVEATRYPGMIHGFAQMTAVLDAARRVVDQVATDIRETPPVR